MTEAPKPNRGGRPRVSEPGAIAAVGLRLFAERGYDAVTMADIADACGIGRSTLLRYFASKADIVWDRSDDEVAALAKSLRTVPQSADALAALCTELAGMLTYDDADLDLLRTQVDIISESLNASPLFSARFRPWESVVTAFITERMSREVDDLYTKLLTQNLFSAGWTALTVWVKSDEHRPDRLLAEAFELVYSGFSAADGSATGIRIPLHPNGTSPDPCR